MKMCVDNLGKGGSGGTKEGRQPFLFPVSFHFILRAHDYLGAWNRQDTGLLASSHTQDFVQDCH